MYGIIESSETSREVVTHSKSSHKEAQDGKRMAKQVAMADMLEEGMPEDFDLEDMMIE